MALSALLAYDALAKLYSLAKAAVLFLIFNSFTGFIPPAPAPITSVFFGVLKHTHDETPHTARGPGRKPGASFINTLKRLSLSRQSHPLL